MDEGALRRLLLDLISPARSPEAARLAAVPADSWRALDGMAAEHRIQPLLHSLWQDDPAIPSKTAESWRAAHRAWAIRAMVQRAELHECCALLESAGIAVIALKGAYLARYAYAEPALRPLRDLDLLLPRDQLLPAFAMLQQAGYDPGELPVRPLEDIARMAKHLPAMRAPRGTVVELHHCLVRPDDTLGHRSPRGLEAAVRAGAIRRDGISFPAPADLLAHIIIHAADDHRLDCGPLVLWDIAAIARSESLDWNALWRRAAAEGWARGAAVLIALVRRHIGADAVPVCETEPEAPAPEILALAPDLLLQHLDDRDGAKFAASLAAAGPWALLRRFFGGGAHSESAARGAAETLGLVWHGLGRLRHTLADLASPQARRKSRELARLSRWLDAG